MFKKGHNTCKKHSTGTYQTDVYTFVHAYVKQGERDAERNGGEYEVDDEAMEFLSCQEYYYNNNMVCEVCSFCVFHLCLTFLTRSISVFTVLRPNWLQRKYKQRISN